jgi:hypothetical protein
MAIANTSRFNSGGYNFYKPTDWPDRDHPFSETPLHDLMAEQEQQAYFGNWLGRQNLLGANNESDFGRSLYDRMRQGYQAGLFDNPEDDWVKYLNRNQYKMRDIMASYDPESRGVIRDRYVGGARWLPR